MYYRFTKEVHAILELAYLETKNFDHREIATVHLLLSLIREAKGLAAHILKDAGVTLENARLEVEKIQGPGTESYKEIPYNQYTREVLELSKTEAEQLKDSEIDAEHLLLGLLRESKGGVIKVLQNLGVDPTHLRNQVFYRLAEEGHPVASPVPTAIHPNGTNSNNAHLALIKKILQHPEGSEAKFVKNNPGIIDSKFIKNMASILEQQGDTKSAKVLRGIIFPRMEETTNELPALPENPEPVVNVLAPQELDQFLYQLLRVSFESKADEQEKVVYNFLRQNLEKLSDRFPEVLQNWSNKTLTKVGDAKKQEFLKRITVISSLIRTFDRGVRGTNLEIALTGYTIVASFLTSVKTPEDWAIIHNYLGLTYLERVQGERGKNLKKAIADFTIALDFYNQEQFPDQRKIILENVKQARTELRNVLGKEEEENEEQEIASSPNLSFLDNKEQTITHENREHRQNYLYLIIELLNSIANQLAETLSSFPSFLPLLSRTLELNNAIAKGSDRSNLIHLAYENFARSIDKIEELRSEIISDEQSKQKWSAKHDYIYRYLISMCLKLGETDPEYKKKAFEYSERNKARSLVELINSRDRYPDYLSAIEIEGLKSLKQEIMRIKQQLYIHETYQLNNNFLNRTLLRQQLKNLEAQKNKIIQGKESNFSFQEEVKALNFQEIKSLLNDSETCAISWFFLENSLVTFIITPQLSEPFTLLLSNQQFLKDIFDWLTSYEGLNKEKDETKRKLKNEEWINSLSYRLESLASSLMLQQIIDKLQELEKVYNTQYKKLLLIPHWFLHLIPIHALPLSKSTCLIDYFKAGVNYIPCCQLLDKVSSYKKELNFNHFFAIQNPTKDLSFASLEVNIIENLVKLVAPNIKILSEDNATKINLYHSKELTVANCIHFSCHGQFIAKIPLFSGVLLANQELLTLGEIFELDLGNCYLITLSACETSQVDYQSISEYVGLSSAFLYAGCSNIVSSLWNVDEKATAFLMIKFYENLLRQLTEKGELNVAIAINQAQLWLRDVTVAELQKWASELKLEKPLVQKIQEDLKYLITWHDSDEQLYQKPFYWAAFCAVGK
ncbi:MAG: CHAT domain-containing protein [Trichodesmium sp. MAG_R04]|nr:CHAT domain-containing protein [Trichodesmium sp. MAG_R04]